MAWYIGKRILQMVPVFFGAALLFLVSAAAAAAAAAQQSGQNHLPRGARRTPTHS